MTTIQRLFDKAIKLEAQGTARDEIAKQIAIAGHDGGLGFGTLTSPGMSIWVQFDHGAAIWYDGTMWRSREPTPHA